MDTGSGISLEDAVIEFKDEGATPLTALQFTSAMRQRRPVLVIDNGSWQCRAGWSSASRPTFSFYNLLAKQKGKRGEQEPILIGGDLGNIEALRWMIRSPFDSNVVVQYDYQEAVLDYVLANMGLATEEKLDIPLLMTEPLLNPAYCRSNMNELLFECYAFPQVAYGIDSMFSFFKNFQNLGESDGIVIGLGNMCTHIIPIICGQMDIGHARRIDLGGLNMTLYLQRLLQLKYPVHAANITITRVEEIIHGYCYYAENYHRELALWRNKQHHKNSVMYFQLPFQLPAAPSSTQEEVDARREENAERLREMNRRRQMEKLQQEEEKLIKLSALQEQIARRGSKVSKEELKAIGVKSMEHLQQEVQNLHASIHKTKERLERKAITVPVKDVTKAMDPETMDLWIRELNEQRSRLHDQRALRKQRKQELGKRRSYASQQRMKILTQLASVSSMTVLSCGKWQAHGTRVYESTMIDRSQVTILQLGTTGKIGKKTKKEDTFGKDDEDWLVYREINREAGESDSEDERMRLEEIENHLLKYDTVFRREFEQSQALLSGAPPKSPEYYRLELGIERFRVPEILFQPSLVGVDQRGILDTLEYMLNEYPDEIQKRIARNIFITGGSANLPQMDQRLRNELGSCLPFETPFTVSQADNPTDDAWSGAALWARTTPVADGFMSRQDYDEYGSSYVKEHRFSNRHRRPPAKTTLPRAPEQLLANTK